MNNEEPKVESSPEDEWMRDLRIEVANLQLSLTKLSEGKARDMSDSDAEKMREVVERLKDVNGDLENIIENSK